MFARLGMLLGVGWLLFVMWRLSETGNMTGANLLEIGIAPAAVVFFIGCGLTWVLSGLFR
jgi:hypothetical protein